MNKLLCVIERDLCDDILIIANNQNELSDYLIKKYKYHSVIIIDESIEIVERLGSGTIYGGLRWIKHN
jgi:hypothetical protein